MPDAAAMEFIAYSRTSRGSPAIMTAPDEGNYEVRYISAAVLSVLVASPLRVVRQIAAGLGAPAEAEAARMVAVTVDAPGAEADYLTIVAPEAPATALGPYMRLRGASEVALETPAEPGAYEIRQIRAADQTVLARAALTVVAPAVKEPKAQAGAGTISEDAKADSSGAGSATQSVSTAVMSNDAPTATLMALVAVDRERSFRVAWTGPGAEGDRIVLAPSGGEARSGAEVPLPADRQPTSLTAPAEPGAYELLYIDGATGSALARRDLEVR